MSCWISTLHLSLGMTGAEQTGRVEKEQKSPWSVPLWTLQNPGQGKRGKTITKQRIGPPSQGAARKGLYFCQDCKPLGTRNLHLGVAALSLAGALASLLTPPARCCEYHDPFLLPLYPSLGQSCEQKLLSVPSARRGDSAEKSCYQCVRALSWSCPRHCRTLIPHMASIYFVPSYRPDAGDSELRKPVSLPKEKLQFRRRPRSEHKCYWAML